MYISNELRAKKQLEVRIAIGNGMYLEAKICERCTLPFAVPIKGGARIIKCDDCKEVERKNRLWELAQADKELADKRRRIRARVNRMWDALDALDAVGRIRWRK